MSSLDIVKAKRAAKAAAKKRFPKDQPGGRPMPNPANRVYPKILGVAVTYETDDRCRAYAKEFNMGIIAFNRWLIEEGLKVLDKRAAARRAEPEGV